MDNTTTSSPMGLAPKGYVPPKMWDEITTDEKVERMRDIIKSLQSQLSRANGELYSLKSNFKKHYHHHDNEVVVPFNEYEGSSLNPVSGSNSVGGFF